MSDLKLMTGNLVAHAKNEHMIYEVITLRINTAVVRIYNGDAIFIYRYSEIGGIPLSADLLEKKCGFKIDEQYESIIVYLGGKENNVRCSYYRKKGVLRMVLGKIYFELRYLHELQNLFTIIRQELKINL